MAKATVQGSSNVMFAALRQSWKASAMSMGSGGMFASAKSIMSGISSAMNYSKVAAAATSRSSRGRG